jgi:23S rRNA pseudouridine955/2504/2580 synthase
VGDDKYGDFALNKSLARGGEGALTGIDRQRLPDGRWDRMFLHARYLRLPHPVTGQELTFEAPLPESCQALLAALASAKPTGKAEVSRA